MTAITARPETPLRVFLVDDHPLVLDGIKSFLFAHEGLELVGEARDELAALRLAIGLMPDVAILDLSMPGLNGIEVAASLLNACPQRRVLILTAIPTKRGRWKSWASVIGSKSSASR